MSGAMPVVLLGLAGFCFGGAYALHSQKRPLWMTGLVGLIGLLSLGAGLLNL